MEAIADLFLNVDEYLAVWASEYGSLVYSLLFLVVFAETGLVVTPFLPGDSLLFAAGALAGIGTLDVVIVWTVFTVGAILGDSCNYVIGRTLGLRILESGKMSRVLRPSYLRQTEAFFTKHGGKTISLARFFPIIRTFAPFMAGIGKMHYPRFLVFSVVGTLVWVTLFVGAGYFFGNIPIVKENFELLVVGIVGFSLIPSVWHAWKSRSTPEEPLPDEGPADRPVVLADD